VGLTLIIQHHFVWLTVRGDLQLRAAYNKVNTVTTLIKFYWKKHIVVREQYFTRRGHTWRTILQKFPQFHVKSNSCHFSQITKIYHFSCLLYKQNFSL